MAGLKSMNQQTDIAELIGLISRITQVIKNRSNLVGWTLLLIAISTLLNAISIIRLQNRASDLQQRVEHLEKAK